MSVRLGRLGIPEILFHHGAITFKVFKETHVIRHFNSLYVEVLREIGTSKRKTS